jgi:hypothetical protein
MFFFFQYQIPVNTTAGSYQVIFTDNVSQINVTIPITISSAPPTSSAVIPSASGSSTSVQSSSKPSVIGVNSAGRTLSTSKALLLGAVLIATVNF